MAVNLKWYGREVEKQILSGAEKAVKKGCYLIEGDAKILQTPHVDTGRLRSSISVNWSGSGMSSGKVTSPAKVEDGVSMPPTETGKFTGRVGSNVEYARRIELGFVDVDSLGRKYNQPPYPFLRPALEKNRSKIEGLFKDLIK